MLKITETFRTKSGAKSHRVTCRFARVNAYPCQDTPIDRKLTPCNVCKPHMDASQLPAKSVGKENLGSCGICLKGSTLGGMTKDAAVAAGYLITKTGTKYHTAECKHVGGKGAFKAAQAPKVDATEAPVVAAPKVKMNRREARQARQVAANLAPVAA